MAFVNPSLLRALEQLRALQGPRHFNWVQSQLTIIQRRWNGGLIGNEGGYFDTTLPLPQHYEIALVSTAQIMGSGGQYETGDIRIGPITPPFVDNFSLTPHIGGFSEAQLHPVPKTDDVQIIYSVTGLHAGEYQFVALESVDPTGYVLVLRRLITKPLEP